MQGGRRQGRTPEGTRVSLHGTLGHPTFPEGHRAGDAARGAGPRHRSRQTSKWQPRGLGRPAGDGAGEGGERNIFGHSLARHSAEEAPPRSRKRGSRVTRELWEPAGGDPEAGVGDLVPPQPRAACLCRGQAWKTTTWKRAHPSVPSLCGEGRDLEEFCSFCLNEVGTFK